MNRLETVSVFEGGKRSRWVAYGPLKRRIEWDAEITSERENEYIVWRSLPGSDVDVDGYVEFKQAPADRGTLISARIEYSAPAAMSGAIAKFLSKGANFAMRAHMMRFMKPLLEKVQNGEIDPSFVISHRVSIDEAPHMYRIFRDKQDHCSKVVLNPWADGAAAA
jgi:uncharacterized membrane protein